MQNKNINLERRSEILLKHPNIFNLNLKLTESLIPYFGFECGDGWLNLIEELCCELEKLLIKYPNIKEHFYTTQVKEKFAGLRFYVSCENREIFDLIQEYEKKSYSICEHCGKPASKRVYGAWYYTLCDSCFNKLKKDKLKDI